MNCKWALISFSSGADAFALVSLLLHLGSSEFKATRWEKVCQVVKQNTASWPARGESCALVCASRAPTAGHWARSSPRESVLWRPAPGSNPEVPVCSLSEVGRLVQFSGGTSCSPLRSCCNVSHLSHWECLLSLPYSTPLNLDKTPFWKDACMRVKAPASSLPKFLNVKFVSKGLFFSLQLTKGNCQSYPKWKILFFFLTL